MQVQLAFIVMLVLVIALVGLAFWLICEFAAERRLRTRMAGAPLRISAVQVTVLARGRRLVLVRSREMEHLLLIGGPADLVVESRILRPGDDEADNAGRSPTFKTDRVGPGVVERGRAPEQPAPNESGGVAGAAASAGGRLEPQQDAAVRRPKSLLRNGKSLEPELARFDRPASPFPSSADVVPYAPMPRAGEAQMWRDASTQQTGADGADQSHQPLPEGEHWRRAGEAPTTPASEQESLIELEDQLADLLNQSRQRDAGLAVPRQWGPDSE